MDVQFFLIIIIFIAALYYIGRIIYRSVSAKSDGCSTGCGKCSANFDHISEPKE